MECNYILNSLAEICENNADNLFEDSFSSPGARRQHRLSDTPGAVTICIDNPGKCLETLKAVQDCTKDLREQHYIYDENNKAMLGSQ